MPNRILLIDDDIDLAPMLAKFLPDYCVITAHSGYEALQMYAAAKQTTPLDLIVSDLAMLDMTGFQLEEAIRATGDKQTKIAFLSGHFDPNQAEPFKANLERAVGVWKKPIEGLEFAKKVREVLGRG